jgi:hypothetical protein
MPESSEWSLPFMLPNQHFVCMYHMYLPRSCYMASPPYPPWFDHPNNIWWRVQVTELLIMLFSQRPVTLSCLGPNIHFSILFSYTLNPCSSDGMRNQVSQPYKTRG